MGIRDLDYFMSLNPHKLRLASLGYEKEKLRHMQIENELAHLQGMYFADALRATVLNAFTKRGTKPFEYPKKAYEFDFRNEAQKQQDAVDDFFERQAKHRELWRKKHNKG